MSLPGDRSRVRHHQESFVITDEKAQLRSRVRAALASVPRARRGRDSHDLCARLSATPWWHDAASVLLFVPLPDELNVMPLVRSALDAGKSVALPRVLDWRARRIDCAWVRDLDADLESTQHGVIQPHVGRPKADPTELQVSIVPGVAFDLAGGRLGRGGGFYDLLLRERAENADASQARSFGLIVGVCSREQVLERVPMEEGDVRVQRVVTPGEEFEVCTRRPRGA